MKGEEEKMSIQAFNTMTGKKEPLKPIEPGKIRMYVCGPTVYNHIHIGNARPMIVFDTVRKYLEFRGFEVKYVVNFTDVDDKIIRVSRETGQTPIEVADQFIASFHAEEQALGVKPATVYPRVTETMVEIIDGIQQLIDKGFAYASGGDVYYRTSAFKEYGKLSHQPIDDLMSGARIEVNEQKENPLDFALWKAAKPGEISWLSPWGEGRPGWHIECSIMNLKYLGETIDIHAGGKDLCFPHHENEIAQSEALTGQTFSNMWIHNGFINIDNEKMSKSLGNFLRMKDMRESYRPEVIRYFMLAVHYRNPINFSGELMENAKQALERIETAINNAEHRLQTAEDLPFEIDMKEKLEALEAKLYADMDDDFNTANAISGLFDIVRELNQYMRKPILAKAVLKAYLDTIVTWAKLLGIYQLVEMESNLDEQVEALIKAREEARANRDWAKADQLRDDIHALGIVLEDTPQGIRWRRK